MPNANPIATVLLAISIVLLAAKLGGALAVRLRQPAVLGELLIGIVLGNLVLFGFRDLEFLRPPVAHAAVAQQANQPILSAAATLDVLARIGVVILLFEIGLESKLSDFRRVGRSAVLVAIFGVAASLALGWAVSAWLLPLQSWKTKLFVGAAICSTSVGITARVLKDLGKLSTREAQVILGAAVIDDVLGLIILAFVEATVIHGSAELAEIGLIILKAAGFLIVATFLGRRIGPLLIRLSLKLRVHGMFVATVFVFCFGFGWIASLAGLDPIIGAFAAGLILNSADLEKLGAGGERSPEDLVFPLSALLVPIFFVMMGFQVDLRHFLDPSLLTLAGALTVAALLGKQACRFGVLEHDVSRRTVGFGMIPRGEVSLILATVGRGLEVEGRPVLDSASYSAILAMVVLTTLVTPPLLSWSLRQPAPLVVTAKPALESRPAD
ncbi:MAG TPA: cation:proton antiporter [Pirellulales bacterium]|nr:cation:proton antiporter [Pirellulales bacterium]